MTNDKFDNFIDDVFKECETIENLCKRYVYVKNRLDEAYKNNLNFLINHKRKVVQGNEKERVENMSDSKNMIGKSQNYDNLLITVRSYAFDSLVYRFKDYQARAFQSEVNDYKYENCCNEAEARNKIKNRHNRDLMRFIEILDSIIGEHN